MQKHNVTYILDLPKTAVLKKINAMSFLVYKGIRLDTNDALEGSISNKI